MPRQEIIQKQKLDGLELKALRGLTLFNQEIHPPIKKQQDRQDILILPKRLDSL